MFTCHVSTSIPSLLNFLKIESYENEDGSFSFSTKEKASQVFTDFTFHHIKKNYFSAKTVSSFLKEEVKTIDSFFSKKDFSSVFASIQQKYRDFFSEEKVLHFEGFVQFRLKQEKEQLENMYDHVVHSFFRDEPSYQHLSHLQSLYNEAKSTEEEIYFFIYENNEMVVRSSDTVYYKNKESDEDYALTNILMLAPKYLRVFDESNQLSKEGTIILHYIFRERVTFFYEKNAQH